MEQIIEKTSFEKNIEQIQKYNSNLALRIMGHNELQLPFQFHEAKSGDIIMAYNGIPLEDIDNPISSSLNLFNTFEKDNTEDNTFIIFGLGLGYLFKRFTMDCKGKIIVYEPNLDIFKITFESVDYSKELAMENVHITQTIEDFNKTLEDVFVPNSKLFIAANSEHKLIYKNVIEQFYQSLNTIIQQPYEGGDLKLNIGPGRWKKQGWKTLDYNKFCNFSIDLRSEYKLPLEDNTIEKAISSHCIEHIEDKHIENMLSELYRCMKPGAILRLITPDAELALEAYRTKNEEWFNWLPPNSLEKRIVNTFVSYEYGGPDVEDDIVKEKFNTLDKEEFIRWCVSQADRSRPYIAHINGHYYNKLEKMLSNAGFINVEKSQYKQSKDSEFREDGFDFHPSISLHVECYKPE